MNIKKFAEKYVKAHEEAILTGNCDALEELEDSDIVEHIISSSRDMEGWEAHKQHILEVRQALSDINMDCEILISEGNLFAILYKVRGRFTGQIPGMPPPTSKEIEASTLGLFHVSNGKVYEAWAHVTPQV